MTLRIHAAGAFALTLAAIAPHAHAGPSGEPIVLEGHALRDSGRATKPKAFVETEVPVSFEMRGTLKPDGTVALQCDEVGHGVLGPHQHRDGDGREEIR